METGWVGSRRDASVLEVPSAGPRGGLVLGNLRSLRTDPLGFLLESARRYGGLVPLRIGTRRAFLVAEPALIEEVLHERSANYSKDNANYRRIRAVTGNGLLTSDGESWRKQRGALQPAFHSSRTESQVAAARGAGLAMLERWRQYGDDPIPLTRELSRLMIEVVGQTMFGVDLSADSARIDGAFRTLNDHFGRWSLSSHVRWLPTPGNVRCWSALRELETVVDRIASASRRAGGERRHLCSLLFGGKSAASRKEYRDQILTFLIAGYETTACSLVWSLYLVAGHPEVEDELAAELERELGGRPPRAAELKSLRYTRMVLQEAMRLYPPVWILSRSPMRRDTLGGREIPARSLVFVSPFVTHHLEELWHDPERFDPRRFAPGRRDGTPRYSYLPFGGGPRACIGGSVAVQQATLILALVVQRYRLEVVSGEPVELAPMVTLRPRREVEVRVRRRGG